MSPCLSRVLRVLCCRLDMWVERPVPVTGSETGRALTRDDPRQRTMQTAETGVPPTILG